MQFSVLGPLEVRADGRALPLGGSRKRALLATLLLDANRPVSIEQLIDRLWGERPPPTAATTVHVYISQLRKQLGRERLSTSRAGYVLEVGADEFDRSRFEQLLARARLAADPAERAALLREALSLWRGPALADLRYEPAAELEAARLDEERLTALEERIDADLELGLHERVVGELEQLTAAHPLRERAYEQLMLALYRSGRQAEALDVYRSARRLLSAELAIEPGPGLRALEQSILNHDPALGAAAREGAPRPRNERGAPREERKIVTVLFADIAGFTRRAEELDPEDVRRLLRRFHGPVRAELERFGGTVEKFIGDAVMAVFGAPVTHEDDAERAVRAAFAVREAVRRACADEQGLDVDLRIGVNTGEVLAVIDADVSAGEGIVAGDVVNTAARLQAAAGVGSIIVGEATRRAAAEAIRFRRRRAIRAKGKASPVQAWEAVEVVPPRAGRLGRASRGPFIGRRRERQLLDDALAGAYREGRVEIVTFVGEPGVGKSRLASEAATAAAGSTWLTGRCLAYGGAPYLALSQIVKARAGITDADSAAVASTKLGAVVPDGLPEAEWIRGHLRLLVGLETDARGERRELFAAWRRFFEECGKRGAVLVVEDIHWADDGLLDFLDGLADWGRGPVLVICTARPELLDRRPDWGGAVTLAPLSDDETERLLGALTGERPLPEGLVARIGGNPLFAEQFARSLGAHEDVVLPDSIQATIAARIDLLPAREKSVLHAAAVIGKSFAPDAVARVEHEALEDVLGRLASLEHRALVRREEGGDFAFGHVLIRDVAYGQIPRSERAEQHRRAAEWLEADGERSDEHLDAVAHHYTTALHLAEASGLELGDLSERAVSSLARAGERSLRLHAYHQALDYFGRARELGGDWRVRAGLGRALQTLGRRHEARAVFEEALATAPDGVAAAGLNRLSAGSFTSEYRYDDADAAFDRAERALEPLEPTEERSHEWIDIQIARLTLLYWRQNGDRMDALIARARPLVEQDGEPRQRAEFLASEYLARILRERWRASDETLAVCRRFLAAREQLADPLDIARARFNVGFVHLTRGDLTEAQSLLEEALATAEQTGDATLLARSLTYLAQLHRRRHDLAAAETFADRALVAAGELAMPEYVGAARGTLAWVAWRRGDTSRATAEADAALEAFAVSAFAAYPWEWTARLPLLAIALVEGRIDDAVAHGHALVDERRQTLGDELESALRGAADERDLHRVVELALEQGFL